jgi:DNA (cytosine-5)-methyltransferase 1
MLKKIRMLDAFAGIGGFHLGIEQACKELGIDFECVGAIEFDKNARETYKRNFPTTPLLGLEVGGDITKIDLSNLPEHDILCGGFPCQPFSVSRKNRESTTGVNAVKKDMRVDLYKYLCTILTIQQPKMFIFENVPGLLKEKIDTQNTKFIDNIIRDIEKCGYGVTYQILNAKDFGSPQNRPRVYFIGYRNNIKNTIKFTEFDSTITKKYLIDILENNVDNYYYLENLWKNIKNHKLTQFNNRYDAILSAYKSGKWSEPQTKEHNIVQTARVENDTPSDFSRQRDRVYSALGLSPVLLCTSAISISINGKLRQLTPREYARIQGFPDTFKFPDFPNSKSNKNLPIKGLGYLYKQFGNAVCVNVVKNVAKSLIGDDI